MLETKQETIISTRNAKVVIDDVQESTSVNSTQSGKWTSMGSSGYLWPKTKLRGGGHASGTAHGKSVPSDAHVGPTGLTGAAPAASSAGATWLCTATYNEGLITDSNFKSLRKFGIMMRRNDQI